MKKHICIFLSLLTGMTILYSCTGGSKENHEKKDSIEVSVLDSISVPDIASVVGTAGDGTSMNVLEVVTDEGDTLQIECVNNLIVGGVEVGERVAVTYNNSGNGFHAMTCINMTALEHLWAQPGADGHKQCIEFNDNGRATTYDMSIEYNAWSLEDGKLLLYSPKKIASEQGAAVDTFEIMELNEDRLVLMHGNLETEFIREN